MKHELTDADVEKAAERYFETAAHSGIEFRQALRAALLTVPGVVEPVKAKTAGEEIAVWMDNGGWCIPVNRLAARIDAAIEEAVRAEREACATVVETARFAYTGLPSMTEFAAAIRARGEGK